MDLPCGEASEMLESPNPYVKLRSFMVVIEVSVYENLKIWSSLANPMGHHLIWFHLRALYQLCKLKMRAWNFLEVASTMQAK